MLRSACFHHKATPGRRSKRSLSQYEHYTMTVPHCYHLPSGTGLLPGLAPGPTRAPGAPCSPCDSGCSVRSAPLQTSREAWPRLPGTQTCNSTSPLPILLPPSLPSFLGVNPKLPVVTWSLASHKVSSSENIGPPAAVRTVALGAYR